MATILQPLSAGSYLNGKGAIFFFDDTGKGRRIGDCDAMSVQVEVTESERYSNEHSTRTLSLKTVDDISATVSITAAQFSNWVRAAALMGRETTIDQAAQSAVTMTIAEAGVYQLEGRGVTNVYVSKGGEEAIINQDYMIDAPVWPLRGADRRPGSDLRRA